MRFVLPKSNTTNLKEVKTDCVQFPLVIRERAELHSDPTSAKVICVF
jgi:hypothetical protein